MSAAEARGSGVQAGLKLFAEVRADGVFTFAWKHLITWARALRDLTL